MAKKTKTKQKQKQKQKQSQRVVVNIDNSKKTTHRRNYDKTPTQVKPGTTIINNIPQQPSLYNPYPNSNIFKQPNPPIPAAPQINQNYYDEQFDRINTN